LWLARVMLTWAVISAATAFVSTPTAFYVMRFLLGVAEAGFIGVAVSHLLVSRLETRSDHGLIPDRDPDGQHSWRSCFGLDPQLLLRGRTG
jgi:hypothetical protein